MASQIEPQPGILDIEIYHGGDSRLPGVAKVYKLSSNENPLGPSPKAIEAFRATGDSLNRYPSDSHAGLRHAIGEVHGLDPERIVCGDGSDEILSWLCYAYAGKGDEVLYPAHGFSMYRISALAASATPVSAPEHDRRVDVDALLAAATPRTRLVFLANPGNPTGTMLSESEVARLADNLPPKALLVLDGAYAEFVEGFDGGRALIDARDNVVMTRTFSKIYGLGGLRIGWAYGPKPVIDVLNRLRGPFNLTAPGLVAAEAAVRDMDWTAHCRTENARWRDWLADELAALGIPSDPAHGNFILARFADEAEADAADAALRARGVIIRKVKGYGLPHCLRITVGDEEANRVLIDTLAAFRKGPGA
jgi:histidinol-phosphate aminotransferase